MVEHATHDTRMPLETLKDGTIIGTSMSTVVRGEDVPVLLVRKSGKLYHVEFWCDPEGNGPGYAYIEEAGKVAANLTVPA